MEYKTSYDLKPREPKLETAADMVLFDPRMKPEF